MFNYFFMNEECAMQMRAIHKKKKREHGGHFCFPTALTLQQSTFSHTRSSEECAGGREGKGKRCLAFLKLFYVKQA